MSHENHYGLVLKHLRNMSGLSVRDLSKKINRSIGWISEIESSSGTARIKESEFNRIVQLLNADQHRSMFRTWVANYKNIEKADRTLDGAVLKYIRVKLKLSLKMASQKTALSIGTISKLENGKLPVTHDLRKMVMSAYGYSPSSFKNLSSDPIRSKAVPVIFKLKILIGKMRPQQIEDLFLYAKNLLTQSETTQKI